MKRPSHQSRTGFTLIELLVAIGIIVILASLTVMVVSGRSDKEASRRGADQMQGWLSQAKARALRDQAPRGLRLIRNASDPNIVTEVVLIEQPDNYVPYIPGTNPPTPATLSMVGTNLQQATINGMNATGSIAVGDMLEIQTGQENAHRITSINFNGTNTVMTLASPVPAAYGNGLQINSGFRIIRQAVPLMGEPAFELPKNVIIDLAQSQNIPTAYSVDPTGQPYLDILFSSSGQVMGALGGRTILWMRMSDAATGEQTLMTIYTRTGHIAAHPVDVSSGDPYAFTRDGLSSGL